MDAPAAGAAPSRFPGGELSVAAYRNEMRQMVADRVGTLWGVFLVFLAIACTLGWYYFPERSSAIIVLCATAVFVGAANTRLVRVMPSQTLVLTGIATTALGLSFCAYFMRVQGLAELCAMGLMIFQTGLVVMFPWGWQGQGLVNLGLVLGYLLALNAGIPSTLPPPYGIAVLVMSATLTTWGAHLIDTYRLAAYRHATYAERSSQAKTEFLATVSHELRTPLTVIIGFTDLLIEGVLHQPHDQRDALRRIRQHSAQLLDLIQSMLDLDRMDGGAVQLRVEEFQVADVLDGLRAGLPANWCKDGVRLDWGNRNGLVAMRSDRNKLEMILRNLIHNALKYTEEGTVSVTAEAEADGKQVRFTVADTGPGIASDEIENIFEMFRQSDSQPPRGGGVGLGLYIVRRLTLLLGGRIEVDSKPGGGSRFSVFLPLEFQQAGPS
jgi:signal transduction histidine kinase